jgi:phosphatidylglycerol:prolipoprotein diacylglycerol transferase
MHPELVHIELPEFFNQTFGINNFILYTYATLIILGTLIAVFYTKRQAKNELGIQNLSNNFFYLIFLAGFIGGKLFYYLERPVYFYQNPKALLNNFSGGFVFYGSFVIIIPVVIWYLKRQHISVLPMLDILAFSTIIVHSIGRFGCFNAGCCYGSPTDSGFGLVFPTSNHIAVHPTQLYEIGALGIIMLILLYLKKRKQFNGQLFLSYVALYAIARSILEIFRGDHRGFVIENILSHSQFIALCLLAIVSRFYFKLKTKN